MLRLLRLSQQCGSSRQATQKQSISASWKGSAARSTRHSQPRRPPPERPEDGGASSLRDAE